MRDELTRRAGADRLQVELTCGLGVDEHSVGSMRDPSIDGDAERPEAVQVAGDLVKGHDDATAATAQSIEDPDQIAHPGAVRGERELDVDDVGSEAVDRREGRLDRLSRTGHHLDDLGRSRPGVA
jgi:hypothetical protein